MHAACSTTCRAHENAPATVRWIASMQGLRPAKGWNDDEEPSQATTAKLARFLNEADPRRAPCSTC